ncbi:ubiquinol-cytochrome C chaperone [Sphingomonas sp. Leaf357]|uniref:ubiquinol-cytochrome C chaperone family protein n=1 Tax=Sphingomonas sp. Leaf357 TaxID=1736350 RepID=UPI0006FDBA2D|nr:ubiquinol-cytochrome C chaperone family protein [Sphingomonas sp. Leaf357]KQS03133.1 ubiquinol-cytochrome C chaperone [Sphingomonas sp. Leaf357]
MGWLAKILGRKSEEALPLYTAVVARARAPHWYLDGQVPDSVDGRFDMIAAILGFVVLRLEQEPEGAATSAVLTERFVDDMDGQLREIGIGDVVVGKHIGKMMGMLGGRLGAYRAGLAGDGIDAALVRNLYRGAAPAPAALAHVRDGLLAFRAKLDATPIADLAEGRLP